MSNQYIRKVSLIIYGSPPNPGGTGLAVPAAPATGGAGSSSSGLTQVNLTLPDNSDPSSAAPTGNQPGISLSDFRISFQVTAMDTDAPPTATIRILNLADSTAQKIQKEFQSVVLQAGYENGNFGIIFKGTIIRLRKGKLSNLDTFVDIMASNLDAIYNFGMVNKTLAAGSSYQQHLKAVQQSVNNSPVAQGNAGALAQGINYGNIPASFGTGGVLPRGKVLFGLATDHLNGVADSTGSVWSIGPDGVINFHELTGYLPGEAVVINAQTGMVGVPAATTQGIEVKCLLNPLIKCGTRIQLNNKDLTTQSNQYAAGFPAYSDIESGFIANTSTDGTYMVLVVEHEGDNRDPGAAWLTSIIALAIDSSGNAGAGTVPAYG
jgi:hypothetical protein